MLKQANIDRLAGLAGLDATKLADAIKDDQEQDVEISEDIQAFSPDELTTRDTNAVEAARTGIETAAVEKAVKSEIKSLGLDLPDSAKKDFSTVLAGHKAHVLAEAKIKPDDKVEALQKKLDDKDTLIETEQQKVQTLNGDLDALKFKSKKELTIVANLTPSEKLSVDDKLTLFHSRYKIEPGDNGTEKVLNLKTNKHEQDSKLNDIPLADVVKSFDGLYADASNKGGRGGGSGAGAGGGEAESMETIEKKLEAEGLSKTKDPKAYYSKMNEFLTKS